MFIRLAKTIPTTLQIYCDLQQTDAFLQIDRKIPISVFMQSIVNLQLIVTSLNEALDLQTKILNFKNGERYCQMVAPYRLSNYCLNLCQRPPQTFECCTFSESRQNIGHNYELQTV